MPSRTIRIDGSRPSVSFCRRGSRPADLESGALKAEALRRGWPELAVASSTTHDKGDAQPRRSSWMPARLPFPNLRLLDHPVLRHKLAQVRERRTPSMQFRRLLGECAG